MEIPKIQSFLLLQLIPVEMTVQKINYTKTDEIDATKTSRKNAWKVA